MINNKKKIVFLTDIGSFNLLGGAEKIALTLANHFSEENEVYFVCSDSKNMDIFLNKLNKKIHIFKVATKEKNMKKIFDLAKFLRKINPDIINIHCATTLTGKYNLLAAILSGKKCVIVSEHAHSSIDEELGWKIKLFKRIFTKINFIKKFVSPSNIFKDYMTKSYGLKESKVEVIYNGTDFNLGVPKEISKKSKIILGSVSNLVKIKGVDKSIKIFSKIIEEIKNIEFLIVGSGPYEENLKKLINTLKINDKIKFLGYIDADENLYDLFDIFITMSQTESFGLTVVEAQSRGIPVIANNVGALPELINNNKSGYIFNSKETGKVATKIIELIENENLYKKMSKMAIKNAEKFPVKKMIDKYEVLFNSIYKKSKNHRRVK